MWTLSRQDKKIKEWKQSICFSLFKLSIGFGRTMTKVKQITDIKK